MDVIQQIKKLNLPNGKYVVISGASLAVRGIRDAKDIDMIVLSDIYEDLKKRGFKEKILTDGSKVLTNDVFEISTGFLTLGYNTDPIEIIKNAEIVKGIPLTRLEQEIQFKRAMGREKDLRDIELIKDYLKKHK